MITARAYDLHVEQLFGKMRRIQRVLEEAGIPYRVIGGVAAFLHVAERNPIKARMTSDIDLAVPRDDFRRLIVAAEQAGFQYRHAAGVEMFMDDSDVGSAIHVAFALERIRPGDVEPLPFSDPVTSADGILLASVADLVRMKLTSFRLKDKVHIQDLDGVGLITEEIERSLPEVLLHRLREVRATI